MRNLRGASAAVRGCRAAGAREAPVPRAAARTASVCTTYFWTPLGRGLRRVVTGGLGFVGSRLVAAYWPAATPLPCWTRAGPTVEACWTVPRQCGPMCPTHRRSACPPRGTLRAPALHAWPRRRPRARPRMPACPSQAPWQCTALPVRRPLFRRPRHSRPLLPQDQALFTLAESNFLPTDRTR